VHNELFVIVDQYSEDTYDGQEDLVPLKVTDNDSIFFVFWDFDLEHI
jgi:hypothetical protein